MSIEIIFFNYFDHVFREAEYISQEALKNNEIKQMSQTISHLNEKIKQLEQQQLSNVTKNQVAQKLIMFQQQEQQPQQQQLNSGLVKKNSFKNKSTVSSIETIIVNELLIKSNDNTENTIDIAPSYDTFNLIDRNPILDNEASKFKSVLIKRGSLASRNLPTSQQRDLFDVVNDLNQNENNNNNNEVEAQYTSNNSVHEDSFEINQNINDTEENNFDGFNSGLFAYRQQNTSNNIIFSPNNINTSPQQQQQQQPQQKYSYVVNSFTSPIEDWTSDQVAQWLIINEMSMYADSFSKNNIDGEKLVGLDNSKLKTLGVKSQKERDLIKTKVKDLKADDKKRFKMLLENTTKKKKLKT